MTNPLLAKIKLPGRIFQLPSKGIFYSSNVLAEHVRDGEVEVRPLSALAEMKLRSPDMLFSGRAVREVCLECIPDIIDPEKLISKDVDAIFCFLKIVTYGSKMTIKSVHECKQHNVHEYIVDIEEIVIKSNNDILKNVEGLYEAMMSNGQHLKLKPVTFHDAIEMSHMQHEVEKKLMSGVQDQQLMENTMVRDLMAIIEAVDGISDPVLIQEWVRSLQKKYFNEIIDRAREVSEWGFDLNVDLTCKDCSEVYKHSLELNPVNFFSG